MISPRGATLGYLAGYLLAYLPGRTLLTYFPIEGVWALGAAQGTAPMRWYGLILAGLCGALIGGLTLKPGAGKLANRALALLPVLAFALVVWHERGWFR